MSKYSSKEILKEIRQMFRDVFKDDYLEIDLTANSNSIEGWDSITNILLIDKIEEHFNIELPIDIIYESENIGDWVKYIFDQKND